MAQPPGYTPGSFSDEAFNSAVLAQLDAEFAGLKAFCDAVRSNLSAIQRDDTRLANSTVHQQAISAEVLALFAASWNPRGGWLTDTLYTKLDVVTQDGETWLCTTTHTSGTFATDQGNGLWMAITQTTVTATEELLPVSSSGTASAYTITTGKSYGSWANVPPLMVDWHLTNNASPTISVDGLAAKNLLIEGTGANAGAFVNKDILVYDAGIDAVVVVGRDQSSSVIQPKIEPPLSANKTMVNADLASVSHYIQSFDISAGSGLTLWLELPAAASANKHRVVTIRVSADGGDGSDNKLQLRLSGGAEHWTGVKKGDFITVVSNGADWFVLDHYESHYARIFLGADEPVAQGASEQLVTWTVSTNIGVIWNVTNDEIDVPFDCWIDFHINMLGAGAIEPEAKLDTTYVRSIPAGSIGSSGIGDKTNTLSGRIRANAGQKLEVWATNSDNDNGDLTALGDAAGDETFATFKLTRIY